MAGPKSRILHSIAVLMLIAAAHLRADTYTAVIIDSPLWCDIANGEKGIICDILRAAVARMGHQVVFRPAPIKRLLVQTLHHADITIIVKMPQMADDAYNAYANTLRVGQESLFQVYSGAFALTDSTVEAQSLPQLRPWRIGVRIQLDPLDETITMDLNKVYRFAGPDEVFAALFSKRIDVAFLLYIEAARAERKFGRRLRRLFDLPVLAIYPVWSTNTPPGLVERMDQSLKQLKREGMVADIIRQYSHSNYFTDY